MQVKEFVERAEQEIKNENESKVIELVKDSLQEITSCKKTLKELEKAHETLLNQDVKDFELNDFE